MQPGSPGLLKNPGRAHMKPTISLSDFDKMAARLPSLCVCVCVSERTLFPKTAQIVASGLRRSAANSSGHVTLPSFARRALRFYWNLQHKTERV